MKIIKDINKLQDYSLIEVNLNVDINSTIKIVSEDFKEEEVISCDEYISRVIPKHLNSQNNQNLSLSSLSSEEQGEENEEEEEYSNKRYKNMIRYYQYSLVKKVQPYNVFGEILLDDEEKNKNNENSNSNNYKKRELTAICNEPSRILYLDISNWHRYYRFRQEAIKMKNLSTILDIPFLREISKEYFKSKIFEHFSLFNYKIGEYVFKQKEKRKKIYFIRSGEVQLIMKASLYDINNIIDKKFDKNDINYRQEIPLSKDIDYTVSNYLINKINNEKKIKTWRILGIYPKDVLGLNEVVDENNNYYFSAKCSSYNNEIYEIDYNKFTDMIAGDKSVKNLLIQYDNKKKYLILNRFKNLRKHYIVEKLKKFKNNKNGFFSQDKLKINNIYPNHFTYKKHY
jgi:CRP-like cAMP-binding protein